MWPGIAGQTLKRLGTCQHSTHCLVTVGRRIMRMRKKCKGPVSEGSKWRVLLTQQVVATHSAVALLQAGIRPEISWQQHSGVAFRPALVSSICSWRVLFMLYCTSLGLRPPRLLHPCIWFDVSGHPCTIYLTCCHWQSNCFGALE